MTMKPFEIQSTALSIGGVTIDTSATGTLVLPGVTRASTSVAIEVDDTEDQTQSWGSIPTVIDGYHYAVLNGMQPQVGWSPATYEVEELDDDGYIDGISVVDGGTGYTGEAVTYSNVMFGTNTSDPINNFDPQNWVEIPFRVRCGAGEIESEFGGGGGSADTGNVTFSGNRISTSSTQVEIYVDNGEDGYYGEVYVDRNEASLWAENDSDGDNPTYAGIIADINEGLDNPKIDIVVNPQSSNPMQPQKWTFDSSGGLTFPDGTTQTTAYTGQSTGGTGQLYIMANVDGTIVTSTDGITWGDSIASGMSGISRVEVHNGVIVYIAGGEGPPGAFAPGLFYSTTIGSVTLCAGTDTIDNNPIYWNNVHYFTNTNKWVAVGYIEGGTNNFPILAHSDNGISWTLVSADNTFVTGFNPDNRDWQLTDVAYITETSEYVITSTINYNETYGGIFITQDVTVPLDSGVHVAINQNFWQVAPWSVVGLGGPTGYMILSPWTDGPGGSTAPWFGYSTTVENYSEDTNWWTPAVINQLGYLPYITEVAYDTNDFIAVTEDGQVITPVFNMGPGPSFAVSVPYPYTTTDFSISNTNPAVLTYSGPDLINNEKIVITGSGGYDGTYYWNSADGVLFNDQILENGFDASGLSTFTSGGTLTMSHGQYFDSAGTSLAYYYIGNDDEQIFRSSNGTDWTEQRDVDGAYFNDFAYGTFGTVSYTNGAELIGDDSAPGTGYKYKVYTDINGYQGGESNGVIVPDSTVAAYTVGDILNFANGESSVITGINNWDTNQTWIQWTPSVNYGETNPQFPITVTSTDYAPATKNTARIKPDSTLASIGQYMEVYTGANPVLDDAGHIHMKGHSGNVELFLGTDDNYVSTKEAGSTPASVKLKSENDVNVVDTSLRMYRNGSWVSVYGDGWNRNIQNNSYDIAHAVVAADDFGDYYVGGEHCSNSDAYISKYSRDGNLVWNKYNNSDDIGAWAVTAVATHGNEVGIVVRTDVNRNNTYAKLMVLDGATGDVKTIKDVYSDVSGVNAYSLIYHSTLGWTIAGQTNSDLVDGTPTLGIGATGQNIIEVAATDAAITGRYPDYSSEWYVSGNGISGRQQLNNDGVGLWQDITVTTVVGDGIDARVNLRATYQYQGYTTVNTWTNGGTVYAERDIVRISGSQLNGIDNMPLSGLSGILPETGSDGTNLYFLKSSFPTLDVDVQVNDFVVDGVSQYFRVSDAVVTASDTSLWQVPIYPLNDTIGSTTGLLTFTRGNDWMACVSTDGSGAVNGSYSMMGKAARTKIRLDMGWMGYTYDFTGGTFTFSLSGDNRPWVWTNTWDRFLEPPTPNDPTGYHGNGLAFDVAEDPYTGGLVAVGYMYYPNNTAGNNYGNFVWKLDSNGDSSWVKAIDGDDNDSISVAVSPVTGNIYTTTRFSSINKFSSNGDLLARKVPDSFDLYTSFVFIERDTDGNEQVFLAGEGSTNWGNDGLIVTKFDADLNVRWSRQLYSDNSSINTNYGNNLKHTVVKNGQASLVGYENNIINGNNDRAFIYTISLDENFKSYENEDNAWFARNFSATFSDQNGWDIYNIQTAGVTSKPSVTTQDSGSDLAWTNYTYQLMRVDLNAEDKGITGVSTIEFSDGGKLDHNPVDIPPSTARIYDNWNYTLQLSDRGRFIMNQAEPNDSYVEDLYITVPRNQDVPFPVGTVITLINSENDNHHIYVRPTDWQSNNDAKIYTPGFSYHSTWSFPGMQTATLMKISTNAWMLTANNVQDRD